ncbi:acid phosphatase AphA [Naematelia encephala]|uniref:Purple acid phosphatase n=1 Tax=Naematelia encephala TaxID=71784 RepID=A0A1Y2B847_9TREE|nr:acid phosphatase AphA [Naematelia encephala]
MISTAVVAIAALSVGLFELASAHPVVNTDYPYTGPAIPVGDWVDQTINGNGTKATNNINVVSLAYVPGGMNVHFQTPFGIGGKPCVNWGTDPKNLCNTSKGYTTTYDRTPPCSESAVTQCSQFFHEVQLWGLKPATTYYYQIPGGNGTTPSEVLSFTTARDAGDDTSFTIAVLNDMGYTNAHGTHKQLIHAVEKEGLAFAWHGGDISYADDWYSGILPCEDDWPVCYNGTSTELPGPAAVPAEYDVPLPAGEIANQGGPLGGDMSVLYESNWDLWQQWMVNITAKVPYMVVPGNHEATCAEFDGPNNELSAYLDNDQANGTLPNSTLTYFSCPESQRNFTAYQHRFQMPGDHTGGVSNFWYSFDYGLAHFVSFNGETDFYQSPEWPFVADLSGNETTPKEDETYITDSGPFGYIDGSYKDNKAYEQYQWMKADLASVDRSKTPWVFAMSHRPMYSSQTSSYQTHLRNAFEDLFLEYGVDAYMAGHIHWYERTYPLGKNATIDYASVIDNNTYLVNEGKSITHLINGMAGNIESHSTLEPDQPVLNLTAVLDFTHYGFSKLTVVNATTATWQFIHGDDGSVGDYLTLIKGGQ